MARKQMLTMLPTSKLQLKAQAILTEAQRKELTAIPELPACTLDMCKQMSSMAEPVPAMGGMKMPGMRPRKGAVVRRSHA